MKVTFTRFFLLSFFLLNLAGDKILAQTVQSFSSTIINNLPVRAPIFTGHLGLKKTSSCAPDTVNYTYNKTTLLNTLSLNNVTSGNAFAQWYPAPQAITVSGFEFFAWQTAMSSAVVSITCRIYNAGIDSMPSGTALASVVVPVDSTFGGGVLTALRKKAIFSTPVTTSNANGYVITLETSSATNVAVVANSWTASPPNGRSEWLSSVRIGTTYSRSYNINIGGIPLNADFIIQPFVSYNLTANFTSSANCMNPGVPFNFTNTSSAVLFNRFYNTRAFFNIPQFSCLWDYGDTTGTYWAVNGSRTYNYNSTYRVKLLDTLFGWTTGCGDSYQKDIFQSPSAAAASNNGPVCAGGTLKLFADSIAGASYLWSGPNGFSSTQRNPEIAAAGISATGLYSVQTLIGQCSSTVVSTYASVVSTYFATGNGPLCAGQNISLNATEINGATYSWTGPNGFTAIVRNPIRSAASTADSGNYAVTISLSGCGLLGPFSVLVPVNANPAPPVTSNNGPLCVGQNLSLTAIGSSLGSYNWIGPNNYSSSQQNPVRPSALNTFAGTYSVTYTRNGCTSAPSNTTVIINNIPAAPTAGNNGPLCSGQTLSLTASLVSGATYNWSGPNNYTSNNQNPTRSALTLVDGGTYSVVATLNGCPSLAATTLVTITNSTPTPSASSNGPLCPGQNLQLSATGIPGSTFTWTGPKGFGSNQQNPIILNVNDSMAGIYSVTATTAACGTSSAANVTLTINSLPASPSVGNNSPVCEGQSIGLTASTIAGATYFWSGPNGFTSSLQNPTISGATKAKGGVYSVYVTVTGCGTSAISNTTTLVRATPNQPITNSNSPVCFGDTIRLNASNNLVGPNATYTWSGPNNFSANGSLVKINAALNSDAGSYAVSVMDSGCSSINSNVNITVKILPTAPVPSSNAPICEGANLNLQASNVSGATYKWSGPNNFISSAQNPGLPGINIVNSGIYLVQTVLNGCLSVPASLSVLINPLPSTPVATNSGPACVGDNLNLRATTIQGAGYNWSGPNFNSNLQNPILVNIQKSMGGSYAVSATVNGCTSLEGKMDVVINNIPTAPVLSSLPAVSACIGDSLRFYANNVKDGVFEWTGPLAFSSNKQLPVLFLSNTAQGGTYSATVSIFGCVSPKENINIAVNNVPNTSAINGLTLVKSGEAENYSVNNTVGSNYDWQLVGGVIQSGAGSSTVSILWGAKGIGSISVTETNASTCKGIKQNKAITIGPATGIHEKSVEVNVLLFPNPTSDKFTLQFDNKLEMLDQIEIIDLLGRVVYKNNDMLLNVNNAVEIPVKEIPEGMYFVTIAVDNLKATKTFIKN